jgi:hypothetical protein
MGLPSALGASRASLGLAAVVRRCAGSLRSAGVRGAAILAVAALPACAGSDPGTRPSTVEQPPAPSGPNTLTDAERAAGWASLFDGRTTTGWRGFRQSAMPAGWRVLDEALTRDGGGGDIVTAEEFANFELALEWRIAAGGNSGVMYRVSESVEPAFLSGPEMQVLDDALHPDGRSALTSAGACYGLYAPSAGVARPAGDWNQARIVADGARVEHWLNGVKVVEYELGSADWRARLEASPFRGVETYGRFARGRIALQDHGDRVAYRAMKIRVLP